MSDFTNETEIAGIFSKYELDDGVDFQATGDFGLLTIEDYGWGEGGWGDIPWGGGQTVIIDTPTTIWTNIETP